MRTSTPRLFLECSNTDCFKYGWTFIPSPRRLCFSRCIFQCYWVRFFSFQIFPRLTTVSTVQTVRNKPEHFQNLSKHSSPHPTNKITREGSQNKKQWFSPRCGEMLSRSISSKTGLRFLGIVSCRGILKARIHCVANREARIRLTPDR